MNFMRTTCLLAICLLAIPGCGGKNDTDSKKDTSKNGKTDTSKTDSDGKGGKKTDPKTGTQTASPGAESGGLGYITEDMVIALRVSGEQIQTRPLVKKALENLPADMVNDVADMRGLKTGLFMVSSEPVPNAKEERKPPVYFGLVAQFSTQEAYEAMAENVTGDPNDPLPPEGKTREDIMEDYEKEWDAWAEKGGDRGSEPEYPSFRNREIKYGDYTLYETLDGDIAGALPGDRWVVMAPLPKLKQMLDGDKQGKKLIAELKAQGLDKDLIGVGDFTKIRPLLMDERENLEREFGEEATTVMENIDTFKLAVDLGGENLVDLSTTSPNAEGAEEVVGIANGHKSNAALGALAIKPMLTKSGMPELGEALTSAATDLLEGLSIESDGVNGTLVLKKPADFDSWPSKIDPLLAGMKAVAGKRNRINNMKQILLAFHNFHDVYGELPANAIYSEDGKPLLSWRVALLPFVEENFLYESMDLRKTWNSDHNKAFASSYVWSFASAEGSGSEKIDFGDGPEEEGFDKPKKAEPAVAVPPVEGDAPKRTFKTRYQVFVGPGSVFDQNQGRRFRDITDGMSNTIMVIETGPGKSVPWSQPADIAFEKDTDLMAAIGEPTDGKYIVGMGDGSVKEMTPESLKKVLRAMVTRGGAEETELE